MKCIYWCDPYPGIGFDYEILEIQTEIFLKTELDLEIELCVKKSPLSRHFDILFFDYGGAGNDFLFSNIRAFVADAKEHPSRFYVIVSEFTKEATKEFLENFGENKSANIFFNIDELVPYLKHKKEVS
jgi:hypothetical protein